MYLTFIGRVTEYLCKFHRIYKLACLLRPAALINFQCTITKLLIQSSVIKAAGLALKNKLTEAADWNSSLIKNWRVVNANHIVLMTNSVNHSQIVLIKLKFYSLKVSYGLVTLVLLLPLLPLNLSTDDLRKRTFWSLMSIFFATNCLVSKSLSSEVKSNLADFV